tara:strand:- start:304 stop:477 length:174 start_codon:yes stop_codon:yes gene_type:complete
MAPRIGDNIFLEPSLSEEDYISEPSDDFEDDDDCKDKWDDIQSDSAEDDLREVSERY